MGTTLQTIAAMACMKSLLMVFNFVFWISGIAILAIGIYMEVELYRYMEMDAEFSGTAPYVLIGTGSLIILMGTLACCCTVKGQPVLLYVYGGFLAMIFVMELGAGISIYAHRAKVKDGFDKGLMLAIKNYSSSTQFNDIDRMQETFKCCGHQSAADWTDVNPPIPPSCCIEPGCDTDDIQQVYSQGCYLKVTEFVKSNIGIVAGTAVGVAFFPLVGVFLSCCLASLINKTKYEQMA